MRELQAFYSRHPILASWAVLAPAMVVILVLAAQDVGFRPSQWAAVIAATVVLAGACAWIIHGEDEDEPNR